MTEARERDDEACPGELGAVPAHGWLTPRGQIMLIAIGIALFNVVLIGALVYLIFVY